MTAVEIHALGLAKWALIPIEPYPLHAIDDGLDGFIGRAALIRIFNTENEPALLLASKEPIKKSGPNSTDVKETGRTRGKPDSYLIQCARPGWLR